MRNLPLSLVLFCFVGAAGCGGASGEPLIAGSATGQYRDTNFTAAFGIADSTTEPTQPLIAIGDGALHCGTAAASSPPSGSNAVMLVPSLDVGNYTGVRVQVMSDADGSWGSTSTAAGTVDITTATAESVAGSVAYSYTSSAGAMYAVNGTFEVLRCP